MFSKLLAGCPCQPIVHYSQLAICKSCGEVFAVRTLFRHRDGTLTRAPCAKTEPDYGTHGPRDPTGCGAREAAVA